MCLKLATLLSPLEYTMTCAGKLKHRSGQKPAVCCITWITGMAN